MGQRMIPVGLAAAHVAFRTWRANAGPTLSPAPLSDNDLADFRRALAVFHTDVCEALGVVDRIVAGRVMARSQQERSQLPPGPREAMSCGDPGAPGDNAS